MWTTMNMNRMRLLSFFVLVGASLLSSGSAQVPWPGQVCGVPPYEPHIGLPVLPSIGELVFDDTVPQANPQWWFHESHTFGLGVKAADFDGNGYPDIVITGNDVDTLPTGPTYPTPAPGIAGRVIYLGFNSAQHRVIVIDVEILDAAFTRGAYGVAVGDVNGDGRPDIAVGRRMNGDSLYFNYAVNQERDSVFINDGQPAGPSGAIRCFDNIAPVKLQHTETVVIPGTPGYNATTDQDVAQTFGIELLDLDGLTPGSPPKRTLDIVTSGPYGIRFYAGAGNGQFTHLKTYRETVAGVDTSGVYRNIAPGDVDGDRDIDLFVTRMPGSNGLAPPDRVWFNTLNNPPPGTPAGDQFTLIPSPQGSTTLAPVELARPPLLCWSYRTVAGISPAESGTCVVESNYNNDADLQDIDGDGDLDLALASPTAHNTIYINDGTGRFGSANGLPNGCPAYVFGSPTPDWPDSNPTSYWKSAAAFGLLAGAVGTSWTPLYADYAKYEFRVPGKLLEQTSSVRIRDLNNDGLMDVCFANRNDIQDGAEVFRWIAMYAGTSTEIAYLDPQKPGPLVYDHIFYGIAPAGNEAVAFCTKPELVGLACDGTSYIEFIDIGGDRKLDWIEANYANNAFYALDGTLQGPMKEQGSYGLTTVWFSTGNWTGPSCGW